MYPSHVCVCRYSQVLACYSGDTGIYYYTKYYTKERGGAAQTFRSK